MVKKPRRRNEDNGGGQRGPSNEAREQALEGTIVPWDRAVSRLSRDRQLRADPSGTQRKVLERLWILGEQVYRLSRRVSLRRAITEAKRGSGFNRQNLEFGYDLFMYWGWREIEQLLEHGVDFEFIRQLARIDDDETRDELEQQVLNGKMSLTALKRFAAEWCKPD